MEHLDSEHDLLVRARTREDLERLCGVLGYDEWSIEDDPTADYRWRLVVGRTVMADYLWAMVDNLRYTTSVKDEIDQGDTKRHGALLRVWSAMMSLQKGGAAW